MQEQLQVRLSVLKQEFETGQTQLRELERQQTYLRETLLRISGAIQILEEVLASPLVAQSVSLEKNGNSLERIH